MKLHLVGGFLGSGKTTAIIAAGRLLAERGERVGVLTNDQGRYLVDTAFVRAEEMPAVEVSGGCFCCNYTSYRKMIERLDRSAHPTVLFAESVGSCADLVATVIRPSELEEVAHINSFTVFADIRLLALMIADSPLPFSEDVVYLFSKQLEEAGLIVVNKSDLVRATEAQAIRDAVAKRFAGKTVRLQSSFSQADIGEWISTIDSTETVALEALELDYLRYGAAEAMLAWYDAAVEVSTGEGDGRDFLRVLLGGVERRAREAGRSVGHIKILVRCGRTTSKLGLTSGGDGIEGELAEIGKSGFALTINARVECSPDELRSSVRAALSESSSRCKRSFSVMSEDSFKPAFPNPEHRMG